MIQLVYNLRKFIGDFSQLFYSHSISMLRQSDVFLYKSFDAIEIRKLADNHSRKVW